MNNLVHLTEIHGKIDVIKPTFLPKGSEMKNYILLWLNPSLRFRVFSNCKPVIWFKKKSKIKGNITMFPVRLSMDILSYLFYTINSFQQGECSQRSPHCANSQSTVIAYYLLCSLSWIATLSAMTIIQQNHDISSLFRCLHYPSICMNLG